MQPVTWASHRSKCTTLARAHLLKSLETLANGIYGHTATVFQNGKVLLGGGFVNSVWAYSGISGSFNVATLYDSATGVFSGTGNMTANRGGHTATLLANGKVLITGGADQDPTGTGLASAELYDPSTGTFTQTGSMAVARFLHTATLLQSGKVLIVGGALTSTSGPDATAEIYDPATGIFTMTDAMKTAREQHTATLLADGRVLIVGGATSMGTGDLQPTATVEVYDPSTGSFSVAGSMAAARTYHTATLLPSGKVLVAGGGDENSTAEIYDPGGLALSSITGGMEIGRSGHTSTLLPNGSVLVAGGGIFAGLASGGVVSNEHLRCPVLEGMPPRAPRLVTFTGQLKFTVMSTPRSRVLCASGNFDVCPVIAAT